MKKRRIISILHPIIDFILREKKIYRIAVFASGAGSNALKIIEYFKVHLCIKVALVVCNNIKAGVLQIADAHHIPVLIIDKTEFNRHGYLSALNAQKINFIVLAGFLWKVPLALIHAYPDAIINIHPALLPQYGGKGMYGMAVHRAVIENHEKESGITIHFVDEIYDHGKIILQEKTTLSPEDTPESLAEKIHALEHRHFAPAIEKILSAQIC